MKQLLAWLVSRRRSHRWTRPQACRCGHQPLGHEQGRGPCLYCHCQGYSTEPYPASETCF